MRQSSQKLRQLSGFDRTIVADRICGFLRSTYRYGNIAEAVEADTGGAIKARAVSKWLERKSAPCVPAFLVLVAVYRAPFLDHVGPDCFPWLAPALREITQAQLEAEIAERQAQLARVR